MTTDQDLTDLIEMFTQLAKTPCYKAVSKKATEGASAFIRRMGPILSKNGYDVDALAASPLDEYRDGLPAGIGHRESIEGVGMRLHSDYNYPEISTEIHHVSNPEDERVILFEITLTYDYPDKSKSIALTAAYAEVIEDWPENLNILTALDLILSNR